MPASASTLGAVKGDGATVTFGTGGLLSLTPSNIGNALGVAGIVKGNGTGAAVGAATPGVDYTAGAALVPIADIVVNGVHSNVATPTCAQNDAVINSATAPNNATVTVNLPAAGQCAYGFKLWAVQQSGRNIVLTPPSGGNIIVAGSSLTYNPTWTLKAEGQFVAITVYGSNRAVSTPYAAAALAGDLGGVASAPTVVSINGKAPAAVATSGSAADLLYTGPFSGTVTEALSAYVSRTIWVEDFGAKGDGTTDDSAAINAALLARGATETNVRLTCGKRYYIASDVNVFGAFEGLEGCLNIPDDVGPPIANDSRYVGSLNTVGGIVRKASAAVNVARGGMLSHMLIVQQGVAQYQDGYSTFAGTGVRMGPNGGTGTGAHVKDVMVLGANLCLDSSSGGQRMRLDGLYCDGINGEVIANSVDTSTYDNVHNFPYATVGFAGYTISSITGDGTTTTVNYTGPSIAIGTLINIPDAGVTNAGDVAAFTGTSSNPAAHFVVTASSSGQVQFKSAFNSSTTTLKYQGTLHNYQTQYRRNGTGMSVPAGHSDDTHFGTLFDFGHSIGFDFASVGIFNVDHIWVDNYWTIGVRFTDTGDVHVNSMQLAGDGGQGLVLTTTQNPITNATTRVLLNNLMIASLSSDCIDVAAGTLMVGSAHVERCSSWGLNVGPSAKLVNFNALDTAQTGNGPVTLTPGTPVRIGMLTTDLAVGLSPYGGAVDNSPVLAIASATIALPATGIPAGVEAYNISGGSQAATVATIQQGYYGRRISLTTTDASTFVNTGYQSGANGNICLAGGKSGGTSTTFGGAAGSILELRWDSRNTYPNSYGGCWREVSRSAP